MIIQELKCWPEYLDLILSGRKTFEVRDCSDRDFCEGGIVILRAWDPGTQSYLKRPEVAANIGYVMPQGAWGLPLGTVVFSLLNVRELPR